MKRFWNWVRDQNDPNERTLRLEGAIAEESWFDDEVTPKAYIAATYYGGKMPWKEKAATGDV